MRARGLGPRRGDRHGRGGDRARPAEGLSRRRARPEPRDAGRGAQARVEAAGLSDRITLVEGGAEQLSFPDGAFDALTFTYLIRYVEDPGANLAELARVVKPGGIVAGLEFGLPRGVWRPLWELYVRVGLPVSGALISPGWQEVGSFLGPSIRDLHERLPIRQQVELWRAAGIEDVRVRRLSLGGGYVTWGRRS